MLKLLLCINPIKCMIRNRSLFLPFNNHHIQLICYVSLISSTLKSCFPKKIPKTKLNFGKCAFPVCGCTNNLINSPLNLLKTISTCRKNMFVLTCFSTINVLKFHASMTTVSCPQLRLCETILFVAPLRLNSQQYRRYGSFRMIVINQK